MATSTDRVTTITFTDDNQGRTFTKSSTIVLNSMRLEENLTSGGLTFGEPCSSMFRCQLEYDSDFPVSRKTKIQVTQLINNQTTVTLFTGMIDSITTDALGRYVTITAYDRMYFLKNKSCLKWWKNYWSDPTNDFSVRGIRENLLLNYNVNFQSKQMMNDKRKFEEPLEFKQITVGELLSYTCAINLAIPHYGRGGILNFIELGTNTDHTIDTTDVEIENCDIETFNTATIDGCSVESSTQCVVSDEDSQTDADNVFCLPYNMFFNGKKYATMLKRAKEFVSVLANYTYRPMSAKMIISDYDLKLGDRVKLDAYYNGNAVSYYTYIFQNVLSGPMLIEQTFKADGEPDYNVKISANIGGKVNAVETTEETPDLEFYLVGTKGKVCRTDLLSGTWTSGSTGLSSQAVTSISYGFKKIFAVVNHQYIYSSEDGDTWTQAIDVTTTYGWTPNVIKYLDGKIVCMMENGNILYSTDGTTWTDVDINASLTPSGVGYYDITYGGGTWVIANNSSYINYAPSLSGTWTSVSTGASAIGGVCYDGSGFVANGYKRFSVSSDATSWTTSSVSSSNYGWDIAYGNDVYVALKSNNANYPYALSATSWEIWQSSDGSNWTLVKTVTTRKLSLTYGNGKFVTVTATAGIEYSTDGLTWTAGTSTQYSTADYCITYTTADE